MLSLIKEELRSLFRNKKTLISVIALLFIPILYSGMFLWAFWDPYDHLADLPVVIVNEDKGAELEGEELKLGQEFVDKLKGNNDFNFIFKSKEDAYEGLKHQEYYLLVEVPQNFSENATTLMDEDPKKLDLIYVPNESFNFLASQIGGTAIEQIKASLSEKITETYADTIFSKITAVGEGLEQASEGAGELNNGVLELKDGTSTLHEKLAELASKSIEFSEGMDSANSGSKELAAGLETLNNGLEELGKGHSTLTSAASEITSGTEELAAGISQTQDGIKQINGKMPELEKGSTSLAEGADNLSGSLNTWKVEAENVSSAMTLLKNKLEPVMTNLDPAQQKELSTLLAQLEGGTQALSQSAGTISNGANSLSSKLQELNKNQQILTNGIQQLVGGSDQLALGSEKLLAGQNEFQAGMKTFGQKFAEAESGANKLVSGATELSGGIGQLTEGTEKISSGAGQLEEGAKKITDGTIELSDGSKELAEKLKDGATEASSVNAGDKTYNMIASPVEIQNEKINEVPNYGTGFAPYFISLGLFVGALLLSIVFPLREPAAIPKNGWSWFTSKFTLLSGIGIAQGLIAASILIGALGLDVKSIPLFLLFVMVTSITFMALIQFFVTVFGDPGRFIAILILIFQLTTSAGTFPLELIPDFLQHFNAFFPMTYTVQGFKAVISSGDYSFMWNNIFVLIGYTVIFMIGSLSYFNFKHRRQFKTLVKE